MASSPLRTLHRPITRDARFLVSCRRCEFSADSAAATEADALAEYAARHRHYVAGRLAEPELTAALTDYKAHPLFQGRFEHADAKRERGAR